VREEVCAAVAMWAVEVLVVVEVLAVGVRAVVVMIITALLSSTLQGQRQRCLLADMQRRPCSPTLRCTQPLHTPL
jgi:hypothetical protein